MMSYTTAKSDSYHEFAEVFTPAGVVFDMILNSGIRAVLEDADKNILDPAVGEGQFPCAELVWKLFFNVDSLNEDLALRALSSLYGIDIQPSNVYKSRANLVQTLCDAYKFFKGNDFTRLDEAQAIVEENIICGDSLKLMKQWAEPQISLF